MNAQTRHTKPTPRQPRRPAARWPWQRSLGSRIAFTYGAVFLVVLALLLVRIGQVVYRAQIEEAEHNLELDAFLAANALEDPLNGYATEFEAYAAWELEHQEAGSEEEILEYKPLSANALAATNQVAERLQQIAAVYATDIGARVTIMDPRGHVVADSVYPFYQVPNQLDQIEVQTALQGEEQHDIRTDPFTGQTTLYVAAPIQQGSQILGIVQLSRPMQAIHANIRRLLFQLAGTGLVALLLVTMLGIWIGRHLAHPVQELEQAALAIAQGDFEQQVPAQTADELGALAQAFNHMVAQVRRMMEQQRIFVANASHELRTPLTNIKLRTETLLHGGQEDPLLRERYLTEIDAEADRLGRLANVLLDLSQLDETASASQLPPEPVNMGPNLIAVARAMRLRTNRAGLKFQALIPEEIPLRVWPDQVEAILANLLDNAAKYTPPGGEVTLKIQLLEDRCQIRVEDTGPGIPEEERPLIFERFYRLNKARSRYQAQEGIGSGAGLGLSIVKTLTERNGGRIWVENRPGGGSAFVVEFPLAEGPSASEAPRPAPSPELASQG